MKTPRNNASGTDPSTVSVVVPLFNERAALEQLYRRLSAVLADMAQRYEIIFVDDGSTDGSLVTLKDFRAIDRSVRYIRFRRNFGKSAALAAGFCAARYDVMVYGDRPRYIPVLASYRGFRLGEVKIDHAPRAHGNSRYGLERVLGGFFSLLTVILMTRYTNKPLHFFGLMGSFLFSIGFVVDAYLILLRILQREWLSNRPLLIIGTMLIIVGVQLVLFGLLAEMVAFSYRRENDYSIVETEAQEDDLIFEKERTPFRVEAEKVAR